MIIYGVSSATWTMTVAARNGLYPGWGSSALTSATSMLWTDDDTFGAQCASSLRRASRTYTQSHHGLSSRHRRTWLQDQQERNQQLMKRLPAEASAKAEALLLSHLTPAQQKTYRENHWFVVEGGKTQTKYRILTHHCAANIEVLNPGGEVSHLLCAHADVRVFPLGDQLLTQKLMLEGDEDAFLARAIRHAA